MSAWRPRAVQGVDAVFGAAGPRGSAAVDSEMWNLTRPPRFSTWIGSTLHNKN
jgi:hypothetical protein